MDILILVIAFLVILLGAELFTNGIEWFGRKLNLAAGRRRIRARRGGHGAARDDDPGDRDRLRWRWGRDPRGRRRGDPGRPVHAVHARDVRDRRRRDLLAQAPGDGHAHGRGHRGARPRHPVLPRGLRARDRHGLPAARARPHPVRRRVRPHRDLHLVREGPLRRGGRGGARGAPAAALPPHGPVGPPGGPGGAAAADRQRPGRCSPSRASSAARGCSSARSRSLRRPSASASCCWRW